MGQDYLAGLRGLPTDLSTEQQGDKLAAAVAELPKKEQEKVAGELSKVWPQDSMHRMITILGSILLALGACAIAVWASIAGADQIAAALVAVATAIVGGIFGFAQASK